MFSPTNDQYVESLYIKILVGDRADEMIYAIRDLVCDALDRREDVLASKLFGLQVAFSQDYYADDSVFSRASIVQVYAQKLQKLTAAI